VEADAGGQASGAARGYELLGVDELGQGWKDDDVELSGGAGSAGAVECGAAVSVSGGVGGSEAGDAGWAECSGCGGCSAGSEESGAAVSVPRRAAGRFLFEFVQLGGFAFEFG
jgi:hypothetical protein